MYVVLFSLLLPPRPRFTLLIGFGALYTALRQISLAKAALTQMPLTMLDLRIALTNPAGFSTAVGWPSWSPDVFLALEVAMFCLVARQAYRLVLFMRAQPKQACASILAAAGIVVLSIVFASAQRDLIGMKVQAAQFSNLWTAEGLSSLSRGVGVVTFLIYTSTQEQRDDRAMFFRAPGGEQLTRGEIEAEVDRYISAAADPEPILPNIILVHLESTFNPNAAFILTSPVANPLFEADRFTDSLGQLRVNVVGGASWVTEFEVMTGLDSRLFGSSGYYAPYSLAPYVTAAFPSYLRSKGYRTVACYSWPGRFYNARNAFRQYGFEAFVDAGELGVPTPVDVLGLTGAEALDQKIASAASRRLHEEADDRPLFAFVSFSENHGPHTCLHFVSQDQFRTAFRGTADFRLNCALNEYIRRLGSTARAFGLLKTFLEERQSKTGRPFVILGYGDHQPHTFTRALSEGLTGTVLSGDDYAASRRPTSINETIFVLESSGASGRQYRLDHSIPATLIPSVLSTYVTRDAGDLYLPVNFYLLAKCGSDLFAKNDSGVPARDDGPPSSRLALCAEAVKRALPILQQSGVVQH